MYLGKSCQAWTGARQCWTFLTQFMPKFPHMTFCSYTIHRENKAQQREEQLTKHSPEAISFLPIQIDHEGKGHLPLWNLISPFSSPKLLLRKKSMSVRVWKCVCPRIKLITGKPTLNIRCLPFISLHLYLVSLSLAVKVIGESRLDGQRASAICLSPFPSAPTLLALQLWITMPGF